LLFPRTSVRCDVQAIKEEEAPMNFTQVMAALGLTTDQLLELMRNSEFPTPTSNDGAGNIVWNAAAVTAFAATMASVATNGWIVSDGMLSSASWSALAATPVGTSYIPAADQTFDVVD
jgi:predicted DNA-binding transcriptional regulator AlpA